jgi:protein transport protein SEC31
MPIKGVDRSATLAFCPTAPFLAAGSVAGAIDLSFSTSSALEASAPPRLRRAA